MFVEKFEDPITSCPSLSWTLNWILFTIVKFALPSNFLLIISHIILESMA